MPSGRPIYEPNPAARIAGHRYDIERLQRRIAGGITFDTDNEGDWLYVETTSHFSYDTEIPLDLPLYNYPGQNALTTFEQFGIALVDKSGYGAALAVEEPSGFGGGSNGARLTADAEFAGGAVAVYPSFLLASTFSEASDFSTLARAEMLLEADPGGTGTWYARLKSVYPPTSGSLWALWVDDVEVFGNITAGFGQSTGFSFTDDEGSLTVHGDGFLDYEKYNQSLYLEPFGDLYLEPGGNIIADLLPTTDPGVTGALWNDAGTVKVSP